MALKGERAPNFNDQCSAFISSDIKVAIQEGVKPEEITAGLVYSICMNYVNRVKGNRSIGKKIFMQGGVCYNKAIPVAMAALTGKNIIFTGVPALDKYVYKNFDSKTNIIINSKLKNTMEEVISTKEFIKQNNISSVTFITEAPHSKRIELFWENFGEKLPNVKFSVVGSELKDWDKINLQGNMLQS